MWMECKRKYSKIENEKAISLDELSACWAISSVSTPRIGMRLEALELLTWRGRDADILQIWALAAQTHAKLQEPHHKIQNITYVTLYKILSL